VISTSLRYLFINPENSIIYETIQTYVREYQLRPTFKEIGLNIKENHNLSSALRRSTIEKFKDVVRTGSIDNIDFLLDKTEKWVQKQRLTKSIFQAADIIKADKAFDPIIGMIEESLKVQFDNSIGHDYNQSELERLLYYKSKETFTATGLKSLDEILGGGIRPSSLFLLAGASHSGKTACKIFLSSNLLLQKENVLFISLEMPELEIAKRIDANLMGTTINELSELPDDVLKEKFKAVKENIGQLVIKEYGAGTFNTLHLKALLDELKSKKDFVPDAVVIDYLGLMTSHRSSVAANSYETLGKVAEDLHAVAKETYDSKGNKGIKMITSSQLNRSAYGNTEAGMEAVSESMKIMMTADVAILILSNDQLRDNNQQIFKFTKNR
jgi:replicative DNA helicase